MSSYVFPQKCRAVVIHNAQRAALDEITLPQVGPFDVAIKVAFVGICVTDLEIFDGSLGYYKKGIAKYPIVPGHEVSGFVVEIGSAVNNVSVGDPVVVECIQGCGLCDSCTAEQPINCSYRSELGVIGRNGGYSEFFVAASRYVHRLPHNWDLKNSCLCEPLAVVLKGLSRLAEVWGVDDKPKLCAVVGAGPLGRLCALVLKQRGHDVTIFDRDTRRLNIASDISTCGTLDDLSRFDAVVEATGDQSALDVVLSTTRTGAKILLLGLPYGSSHFSFENLVAFDKTVVGSVGSSPTHFNMALKILPELDVGHFIGDILPLHEFEKGWSLALQREHLKILLTTQPL